MGGVVETYLRCVIVGCSFTAESEHSQSWATKTALGLGIEDIVNLAMPGAGAIAIANTLTLFLEQHPAYTPESTLVLFNVTDLDRWDTACSPDHPRSNGWFGSNEIEMGWINEGSFINQDEPFHGLLQKHMGYEALINMTCNAYLNMITYLEHRGYDYRYTVMRHSDFDTQPMWSRRFHEYRDDALVGMPDGVGMWEYVERNGLTVSDQDPHPNAQGHQQIAEEVLGTFY